MDHDSNQLAILFPGGGAQHFGMGKSFYEQFACARLVFEHASDILHMDMPKLCFTENPLLNETENAQPALLTTQVVILKVLLEQGIEAQYYAGLSGGEYGALVAVGAMKFEDALPLVKKRGYFMQTAVPLGVGMMSAIIGLKNETVEKICKEISSTLGITNYNCPGQVVIGGYKKDVLKANAVCEKAGAVAIRPLPISAPSHCLLLKDAAEKFEKELKHVELYNLKYHYISSVTALEVTDLAEIKPLLVRQLYSPVKWQQTLERLCKVIGIRNYIEIDSDTTHKLFKFISRKAKVRTIMEVRDLYENL